ncbi:hypothetical protein [Chitinimonas sp.]|uniref:hypothetical protein n=1 Tax=Chitinimonas sp. TaxID=1934313 RepID=UPI0035B04139
MSLIGVMVACLLACGLSACLFMALAFLGGGLVNGRTLSRLDSAILTGATIAVPASALVGAAMVVRAYWLGASAWNYLWLATPLCGFALLLAYVYGIMLRK